MLSVDRENELKNLLNILKIDTKELALFDIALTHPSYNYEQNITNGKDYERLEFLGDSVVRLVVSNYLYDKFSDFPEGKLTKLRSYLVSDDFFSKLAINFGIDKYLNIGKFEEKDGGRKKSSILACSMEAIYGAIFKTLGFEESKQFIYSIYDNSNIDVDNILYSYNSKEMLQQYTQKANKDLPEYKIIEELGEAHDKTYKVSVFYHGEELGTGIAKTKKEAEKQSAFEALKKLKVIEDNNE